MQDFVWQQKAMTDNARHSEHQTSPRVSYLWAGAKKSATIMIADWVQGHAPYIVKFTNKLIERD